MSDSEISGSMEEVEAGAREKRQKLKKQKSKNERKGERKDGEEEAMAEQIAGRVIEESEIGRFVDLGLGRGVDATKPSPWLSKSSFQVREVTFDNIIGTEEGGLVNNFEELVESVQQLQTNMSASVPASQQVSVGVDSELSRSYSKTKKSVGTKVLTRTISFRADFDDICVRRRKGKGGKGRSVPQRALTLPEGDVATAEAKAALVRADSGEDHEPTFEERLSKWIIDHLNRSSSKALDDLEKGGVVSEDANPIDKMIALTELGKVTRKDLRPLCHDFVAATCITHYVCGIELGAAKYKVMSEEEVQTKLKTKGKIGVSSAADVSVSQEAKWSRKNKEKHMTKIGIMKGNGKVERGTTGEAVVGVKFQPLSSVVVRCSVLKKALEAALQRYIDSQGVAKYGPFYISCDSEQLFFKVEDNKVAVTDDVNEASEFYVMPCEEDGAGSHFSIFYNSESKLNAHDRKHYARIKPIPRYLCASVNYRGMSDAPLELKLNAKESKSLLVLHDRRSKHLHPVELTDWINGKEVFYINCKHRSFKKDSYITVKSRHVSIVESPLEGGQIAEPTTGVTVEGEPDAVDNAASSRKVSTGTRGAGKTYQYTTCCRPSISSHDDHTTFMLFRLIRVKQKDNWDKYDENDESEQTDSETRGDRRRSHDGPRAKNKGKSHSITEVHKEE